MPAAPQGTAPQLAMVEQLRVTRRLCHLFKHMHKDFAESRMSTASRSGPPESPKLPPPQALP